MINRGVSIAIILLHSTIFASAEGTELQTDFYRYSASQLSCTDGVSVRITSEKHTPNGSSVTYRSDFENTGEILVASGLTSDLLHGHENSDDQPLTDETVVYARLQEDLLGLLKGIDGTELVPHEKTTSGEHVLEKVIIRIDSSAYPVFHFGETAGQVYRLGRAMAYDDRAMTKDALAQELMDALVHCTFVETDP